MIDIPDAGEIKAKITIEYDGSGVEKAKEDLQSLGEITGGLGESTGAAGDGLAALDEQMGKNAESARSFTSAIGELPKMVESGTTAMTEMSQALETTGSAFEVLQEPMGTSVGFLQEASPVMQEFAKQARTMVTEITPLGERFAQLGDSFAQSAPLLPVFSDSLHSVSESFDASAYGLNDFAANMDVFHEAMTSSTPFTTINQHLLETGQNWGDFTSSIGEDNAAMLEGMAKTGTSTSQMFGSMSSEAQVAGKTFHESANSAQLFTEQFNAMGGAAEEAGGVMKAAGMGETFMSALSDVGGAFGGIVNGLSQIAMPIMAVQMIGMAVGQVAQGIYDAAVIAEGPAAHSFGTFTGSVDALGQTMQKSGAQFSESFGQQIMPTLDAINYSMSQGGGSGAIGGYLGATVSTLANVGQIAAGLVSLTVPGMTGAGLGLIQAGGEGFVNQIAPGTFQGPPPEQQARITYEQQLAALPATVIQQTYQAQAQTALNLADATSPTFLQSQDQLAASQQIYQRLQASYNASHPMNQYQMLQDAQYQAYAQQQDTNYQSQVQSQSHQSIAQAIGDWFGGGGAGNFFGGLGQDWNNLFGGASSPGAMSSTGGCFPAGTSVLLANGDEKPIETLQIGEEVLACDGTAQQPTTVLALIKPPPRQVYKLTFSDGNTLTTTDSHPIATKEGWKSISPEATRQENPDLDVTTLVVGDRIHTIDGTCELTATHPLQGIVQVYNITVDSPHTFYANKILVHNKVLGMANNGTGSENVSLSHTFTATVNWAATGLEKQFTAAAQWAEQNLVHTAVAAAQWAEQNLIHTATAAAQWAEQNLTHEATAAAEWAEQNLIHPAIAVAQWAEQGLMHEATAVATWAEQGLEHLFTGKASWIGQDLEHLFTGVAQWTAQNLNPTFTVNPSVTMLAEGASNFAGGPALVAEAGYPEVVEHNGKYSLFNQATLLDLPAGANVYPMKNVTQFADGTGDPVIPITLGGRSSGMPESINLAVYLDSQSILSAIQIPMAQNIRLSSGMRGF